MLHRRHNYLQKIIASPLIAFQCSPAGEIASPECMAPAGVREEIVRLLGPHLVQVIYIVGIAGGRGVEHVYIATISFL